MKLLTNRYEIADAINIKRLPTVRVDLADADEYGLVSQKVLIDNGHFNDGTPYLIRSEIRAYSDERKWTFSSYGTTLSSSFTYEDMENMVTYANAPVIKPDTDIVLAVVDSSKRKMFCPVILHTGNRIDPHCSTPLTFTDEDNDATTYMLLADEQLWNHWMEIYKIHHKR